MDKGRSWGKNAKIDAKAILGDIAGRSDWCSGGVATPNSLDENPSA